MNRYVILVGIFFTIPACLWAHLGVIQSNVLIRAKSGSQRGQVHINTDAGQPEAFVITNTGQIFILDVFGNHVLHYNSQGKLINIIPIPSSRHTTANERKGQPELGDSIQLIDSLHFLKGAVYALQGPGLRLLKLKGNSFVDADDDENAVQIRKLIESDPEASARERRIEIASTRRGSYKLQSEWLQKIRSSVSDALVDKQGNLWALAYNEIRVIDPSGNTIYESHPHLLGHAVSESGDLFVLSYMTRPVSRTNSDPVMTGVEITRYTLH